MSVPSRLERAQTLGFPVAGEPLAVDLADTIIATSDPVADLLPDEATCRLWWTLQLDRLPEGASAPALAPTVELRDAVRELLDSHIAGALPGAAALERVNEVAASMTFTRQLVRTPAGWSAETRRHPPGDQPDNLALAAVAESLIEVLAGSPQPRLRRCQNPACSMLFVASDARRKFCTQNICANRMRAARYYRRHRSG